MITFLEIVWHIAAYIVGISIVLQVLGIGAGVLFGGLAEEIMGVQKSPTTENASQGLPPERSTKNYQIDDEFGF